MRLIFRLLSVLTLVWLVACNGEPPAPTPTATPVPVAVPADEAVDGASEQAIAVPIATPVPSLDDGGHLVIWHSWAGADADALSEMLFTIQGQHRNFTFDTLFVGYRDLAQSYADAVQAGSGPDLLLAPNWWLGDLVAGGVVAPLDGVVMAETLSLFWPAALDNLRWDGHLYGLPTNVELVSLFYNRALVDPANLPATTGDLLALSRANPADGVGLYASLYHLYWGVPAYGAQLLDEESVVILDQTGGTAEFLGWLAEADATPGNFVDFDYGALLDRFKKYEYAFLVDGPWAIDELRDALGDDLSVTLLPSGPAGPAQPWLSADGIFLNPHLNPEQQMRALLLAQALTNAESGTILARRARRLPANRDADAGADPILQGFMQQAANATSMPTVPEMEEVWGYGGDMILKVLGGADPSEAVRETAALINEANGK